MSERKHEGYGIILPMVLKMTRTDIAYFSPEGNLIFCLGDTLAEGDFHIPNQINVFLNHSGTPVKIRHVENGRSFLITYALVKDRAGNTQGIILIKQDKGKAAADDDGQPDRGEDPERPAGITREQSLSELFKKYPEFRSDFFTLDEQLQGLNDPLALKMIQRATVGELAKSLRVDPDELAQKIQRLLNAY
jgi:hypothetical protein